MNVAEVGSVGELPIYRGATDAIRWIVSLGSNDKGESVRGDLALPPSIHGQRHLVCGPPFPAGSRRKLAEQFGDKPW